MKGNKVIVIAGPNGAGKTTFARSYLPKEAQCLRFINADLIAAGLSPFAPEAAAFQAGRLMLEEMEMCVQRGENFAIETTLSGLGYVARFREWRTMGYRISLSFLCLPDADAAVSRVAQRVRHGGHHVPEAVIRRRFAAGSQNFERTYRHVVDSWLKFDNFGPEPVLLEEGTNQ